MKTLRWLGRSTKTYPPATGYKVWYDASEAGSVLHVAGAVHQWNDLSGNNLHQFQSTGTAKPSTGTRTSPSGLNVIDFDGSSDYLLSNSFTIDIRSAFVVVVYDDTAGSNRTVFRQTASPITWIRDTDNAAGGVTWQGGRHTSSFAGGVGASGAHVLDFVMSDMTRFYQDGTQLGGDGWNFDTGNATGQLGVGSGGGAVEYFDGGIGELLLYESALSTGNRQAVEAYLAAKWISAPAATASFTMTRIRRTSRRG